MSDVRIRCVQSDEPDFTAGKYYDVRKIIHGDGTLEDEYYFIDDSGDSSIVYYPSDFDEESGDFVVFELVENPEDSFCTEQEDEEFKRIERKQQETVDCSVAVAHHIHELQKWLKHIGCDDEMELKITSNGLWVSPCAEELYEAKEGGVGTLIEYMRHMGGANKCLEKMGDVG